jgi:two-component system, NarL family, nitrate/nitrite response regulator NarL
MQTEVRTCTVVLGTDIRLVRDALQCAIHRPPRYAVIGAGRSAKELLHLAATLKPDIVLTDSVIARAAGLIRAISRVSPETRTVAFAVGNEAAEILACAEAGVSGYALRDAPLGEIANALDAAIRGEVVCPPAIVACAFARIANLAVHRHGSTVRLRLPDRQTQILSLIDEGLSNKEIACRLDITLSTVKNHVHALLTRMGVRRRSQAVAKYRLTHNSPQ